MVGLVRVFTRPISCPRIIQPIGQLIAHVNGPLASNAPRNNLA